MPLLQVRDCPEDLYERLRACAAEENRSIAQQNLYILRKYLDKRDNRREENPRPPIGFPKPELTAEERIEKRKRIFAECHEMAERRKAEGRDLSNIDIVQLIRESREEDAE